MSHLWLRDLVPCICPQLPFFVVIKLLFLPSWLLFLLHLVLKPRALFYTQPRSADKALKEDSQWFFRAMTNFEQSKKLRTPARSSATCSITERKALLAQDAFTARTTDKFSSLKWQDQEIRNLIKDGLVEGECKACDCCLEKVTI